MTPRPLQLQSVSTSTDVGVGLLSPELRGTGEIVPLTSLRGVAAMAVVMQHFSATAQQHSAVSIPSLVPHGYLAVDLFFVLSGFIMAYTYLYSFQRRGMAAFPAFLGKRVARIVPLNTAVIVIFLIAGAASTALLGRNIIYNSDNSLFDAATSILMLQGFGIGHNINGPSWSISTEFMAYFLFPLLAGLMFSRRMVVYGAAAVVCVCALTGVALSLPRLGLGADQVPLSLVRCASEFTLGLGCYRLTTIAGVARLLRQDVVSLGLIAGCLVFMLLGLDLPAALLFPGLVASLAVNRGRVAGMMSASWVRFLGVVSFSLYLIHQLFRPIDLQLLQWAHPEPLGTVAALSFAFAGSVAVVPFAWLAYCLIERPGRVFVRYVLGGTRPAVREADAGTGV